MGVAPVLWFGTLYITQRLPGPVDQECPLGRNCDGAEGDTGACYARLISQPFPYTSCAGHLSKDLKSPKFFSWGSQEPSLLVPAWKGNITEQSFETL